MSTTTGKNPLHPMRVSARDQAIYQAVMLGTKSQRAVALEHNLSQTRVSAIIKRVTRWLSQGVPPGLDEIYRRERLRVVSRVHRMRLDQLFVEAVEAWHKSDEPTRSIKEKVVKGEVVSRETLVHTQSRNQRYLKDICGIVDRIVAFEGFDALGNVDESCQGRVYEEPEHTPVNACREVKRRTILGGFDTPGDEGIPGMWEKEMKQRNAAVGVANAECGLRSDGERQNVERRMQNEVSGIGEAMAWEGEAPAEPKTHRQQGALSLAPVLRGEGRGEGPELREEKAITNDLHTTTATTTESLPNSTVTTPTQLLSNNSANSAQAPPPQSLTNFAPQEKTCSEHPPKVPRYRLMGTAAEMAVSKNYDEFFSPEEKAYRALEKAKAERRKRMESCSPHQPLTPTLSPEYRGEGAGSSPHRPNCPLPTPASNQRVTNPCVAAQMRETEGGGCSS